MLNCVPFDDVFVILFVWFFFSPRPGSLIPEITLSQKPHAIIFVIKVFEKNVPVLLSAA